MSFRKFENNLAHVGNIQHEGGKGRAFIQNLGLFFIASFLPKATVFLMLPLYTHCLTTEEYGVVDLLNSTVQLVLPFCTLQIQDAMLRFALNKERDPSDVITIGAHIVCIGTSVLAVLCFVAKLWLGLALSTGYYFYIVGMVFLYAVNGVASYFCKGIDKVKIVTVANVSSTLITVLCNLVFLLVFEWSIDGYLLASCIGMFAGVVLLVFGGKLFRYIRLRPQNRMLYREIILFSLPMILSAMSWWVNTSLDKYLLNVFYGSAVVGIYAVANKIPNILSLIGNVVANAYSISAIKHFDPEDKDAFLGSSHSRIIAVYVLCASALMIFNRLIAKILFANEFYVAWRIVPILLLASLASMMSLVCEKYYLAVNKTTVISATAISGGIVNLVVALILIPHIGNFGAAIASACGFGFCWVVRYIGLSRFIKLSYNRKIEFIMLLLLLIQALFACSDDSLYIAQVAVFIILVLLNGKDIRNILAHALSTLRRSSQRISDKQM